MQGNQAFAHSFGTQNMFIGQGAGNFSMTGASNTGVGSGALALNMTGSSNTALGQNAGVTAVSANANTAGSRNTFIGFGAGSGTSTQLTNATAIGANSLVSASNSIVLGGTGTNAVKVGIGTRIPGKTLDVVGDIRARGCLIAGATTIGGTCFSDVRLKVNIEPFAPVLAKVALLQPVHFDWNGAEYPDYDFGTSRSSGLIAQQVEKIFPEYVSEDERGLKQVNYSELPYLMLEAIRELKAQNDGLREENGNLRAELKSEIEKHLAQAAQIEQRLRKLEAALSVSKQ